MPELRHDAISGLPVILAVGRAARPFTVAPAASAGAGASQCPFCPDHEHETPPEVARTGAGAPETPGWRVRVVPNLYPIVPTHEVVIMSPGHEAFGALADEQAVEVLTVLRDRTAHHLAAGLKYVQVLVNQGRAAGASIAHPHAQIVGLDFVPPAPTETIARFEAGGGDLVAREIVTAREGGLVVVDGPSPAWSPPAALLPYWLRVAHRSTRARFDEATDAEITVVARALREAVARLDHVLGSPAYNVVFHTAPPDVHAGEFHWYVDLVPRVTVVAGFECGSGVLVNTVDPAAAAEELRAAAP
jgi:UDPglucose--hexose-1-phosphate uridylyltransferase